MLTQTSFTERELLFDGLHELFHGYSEWLQNSLFQSAWLDEFIVWDNRDPAVRMLQLHMAPLLANSFKTKSLISSAPESCGSLGMGKFDGHYKLTFVAEILGFWSNCGIFKVERDRLFDVFQRLLESFALRRTARQVRDPDRESSVGFFLKYGLVFK